MPSILESFIDILITGMDSITNLLKPTWPVLLIILIFCSIISYNTVKAAEIMDGMDASKIKPIEEDEKLDYFSHGTEINNITNQQQRKVEPEAAKNFKFFLHKVEISGMKILDPQKVIKIYSPYLLKEINLSKAYEFAQAITDLYHEQGYFLSLAYIPDQKINEKQGIINIKVIEGYIAKIELPENTKKYNQQILEYLSPILNEKPINNKTLESKLLRIRSLFGYTFKGTLINLKDGLPGTVKLVLNAYEDPDKNFKVGINNFASKFVGPYKGNILYNYNISPFNQIKISLDNSILGNMNRHHFISLKDNVIIDPYYDLSFGLDLSKMLLGGGLDQINLNSGSNNFHIKLNYKLWKQRNYNVSIKSMFSLRNSRNNALNNLISRDKIRTFKLTFSYDFIAQDNSYNSLDLSLTKGLKILHSSKKTDSNLSRQSANPNFNKLEINFSYLRMFNNISLSCNLAAQYVDSIMFSAEEFSFGGPGVIGKAFDSAEINGDHGVSASIELGYRNLNHLKYGSLIPYVFYDLGYVWRKDYTNRAPQEVGASCGFGLRYNILDLNANLGLAWPKNRDIANPIYGKNARAPRFLLEANLNY